MPRPSRFTPGKETRYPLYRRLGGPQGQSAEVHNRRRNNSIHFLEITLKKTQTHSDTAVFRAYNDSLTDCIIPKTFCHPTNHKMASNRYFYCRIHPYHLEKPEKETKPNKLRNNLHNNQ
jgi:hypothetical protein